MKEKKKTSVSDVLHQARLETIELESTSRDDLLLHMQARSALHLINGLISANRYLTRITVKMRQKTL